MRPSSGRSSTAATSSRRDGARADLRRVRRRQFARAPLRAARRLRLHGADGGRPRSDRGGGEERVDWLTKFYFGDGDDPGLHHLVTDHLDEIDARAVNSIAIPGSDAVVRVGRYGPYLERGEQRASMPADVAPDELTAKVDELLSQPDSRSLGIDPRAATRSWFVPAGTARTSPKSCPRVRRRSREPRPSSLRCHPGHSLDDALRLLSAACRWRIRR